MLGLYRDEMDHPGSDDIGLAELSVLKKRQLGEDVGTMRRLVWVGESYRDLARAVRALPTPDGLGESSRRPSS